MSRLKELKAEAERAESEGRLIDAAWCWAEASKLLASYSMVVAGLAVVLAILSVLW